MDYREKLCSTDYVPTLPKVAVVLGATYESGAFEAAEEEFHASGARERWWTLRGTRGALRIHFEQYESYYFGELIGEPEATAQARAILDEEAE